VFIEDDVPDALPSREEVTVLSASSHDFITFSMPASQGRKRILVQLGSQVSDGVLFTYSAPVLQTLSPAVIPTGGFPATGDPNGSPAVIQGVSFGSPCPPTKPFCGHRLWVEIMFTPINVTLFPDLDTVRIPSLS
jgi:hypothetical protein